MDNSKCVAALRQIIQYNLAPLIPDWPSCYTALTDAGCRLVRKSLGSIKQEIFYWERLFILTLSCDEWTISAVNSATTVTRIDMEPPFVMDHPSGLLVKL